MIDRLQDVRRSVSALLVIALALGLFFIPASLILWAATDPALAGPGVPRAAWYWHRNLSRRYETWARERVASKIASKHDGSVSGTEWPLFGTVFYLLATEELEKAARTPEEKPSVYARGALEAAADLVADLDQGTWVKQKWGPDYLHKENIFYRYLVIFGLGSYEKITGDKKHRAFLEDQTNTLAAEFLSTPRFFLDDYPGECWPSDCLWSVAAIRRADQVLGTDHSALVAHAVRNIKETKLLDADGMPPYMAYKSGDPLGPVRGCSSSSFLCFAPELSPELARGVYAGYERKFWQRAGLFDGFREYPVGHPAGEWGMDVDGGPIIMGHGVSACCFGIAAARANGRFDHARTLAAEALVWSWPLPDGQLFVPQVLSNQVDAPLLGESGVLYCITRQPAPGMTPVSGGSHSPQFYLLVALYFVAGTFLLVSERRRLTAWRARPLPASAGRAKFAFQVFVVLLLASLVTFFAGHGFVALALLLLAIELPERIAGKKPVEPAPPPSAKPQEPESWT